jgi:hypothetical protein
MKWRGELQLTYQIVLLVSTKGESGRRSVYSVNVERNEQKNMKNNKKKKKKKEILERKLHRSLTPKLFPVAEQSSPTIRVHKSPRRSCSLLGFAGSL